ncbi:MAG TPA: metabolite traffic protein EboE [Victivallales bacterium]|nr:metabolite traffic protein EboE [Victivallales bacterium]
MKIYGNNHLCYCFNVFDEANANPSSEQFTKRINSIRNATAKDLEKDFGLGLWLNHENLKRLSSSSTTASFKETLKKTGLYVFTVNAFPYSTFHGRTVKADVYMPDWRSEERLEYSMAVADLLAQLLPDGLDGSISTVPGGYKTYIKKNDFAEISKNILKMNQHLMSIYKDTGKKIRLAIEFEPDCIWEDTEEFIDFKQKYLSALDVLENFIGICYDCSHAEVIGADIETDIQKLKKANTATAKIQISAALSSPFPEAKTILAKFAEDTYLHQTTVLRDGKIIKRYRDLKDLLSEDTNSINLISHYHLPIFFESSGDGLIKAKKDNILKLAKLLRDAKLKDSHLEIETYTYSVLPQDVFDGSVEKMIEKEYAYFLKIIHPPT